MGKKSKHNKKFGRDATIDRPLTAPESEAQAWERRTRLAHQLHESRQRAQGAFRRNAKVDAAMQQLLSTTEDPRGPLGLQDHYVKHQQWQDRPRGGMLRYAGTPEYTKLTDEWIDHLMQVCRGYTLDPPPKGSGQPGRGGTDAAPSPSAAAPHKPHATGGLGGVDVGALGRARARLLAEEPTLSFAFEECCMRGQTEASVGARLGVQQRQAGRLKWKAIAQIRAWIAEPQGDRPAAAPGCGQDNGAHV